MKTITSRKEVNPTIELLKNSNALLSKRSKITESQWELFENEILVHKVKFPILEYVATEIQHFFSDQQLQDLLNRAAATRHMSSYPVIGKILQCKLDVDLKETYREASDHIIKGNEWYVCDIFSERVFGEGLLRNFKESFTMLSQMGNHENMWIQRSIGIATHYATKKKLPKQNVEQLLFLMLAHGHKTQLYIKKGIGWPAKTIAKFHPDLIYKHEGKIKEQKLSKWFKNKINIGLSLANKTPISYE